jgi:hypothetical protein
MLTTFENVSPQVQITRIMTDPDYPRAAAHDVPIRVDPPHKAGQDG